MDKSVGADPRVRPWDVDVGAGPPCLPFFCLVPDEEGRDRALPLHRTCQGRHGGLPLRLQRSFAAFATDDVNHVQIL